MSFAIPGNQKCLVSEQTVSQEKQLTQSSDTAMHIQRDTMMPLCPQAPPHPVYMDLLFNYSQVPISMVFATKSNAYLIYVLSGFVLGECSNDPLIP